MKFITFSIAEPLRPALRDTPVHRRWQIPRDKPCPHTKRTSHCAFLHGALTEHQGRRCKLLHLHVHGPRCAGILRGGARGRGCPNAIWVRPPATLRLEDLCKRMAYEKFSSYSVDSSGLSLVETASARAASLPPAPRRHGGVVWAGARAREREG